MNNKITEKWKPVLNNIGINKNFEQYALYCEFYKGDMYLPLSLKILTKLDIDDFVISKELNDIKKISKTIAIQDVDTRKSVLNNTINTTIDICIDYIKENLIDNKVFVINELINNINFSHKRNKIKIDIELSVDFK